MWNHKDSCLSPVTCSNHAIYLFSVPNWSSLLKYFTLNINELNIPESSWFLLYENFKTHLAESWRQRVFWEHEMILDLLGLRCKMFLSPCKICHFYGSDSRNIKTPPDFSCPEWIPLKIILNSPVGLDPKLNEIIQFSWIHWALDPSFKSVTFKHS